MEFGHLLGRAPDRFRRATVLRGRENLPADGNTCLVAASPTGARAGDAGEIAHSLDGSWRFHPGKKGLLAYLAGKRTRSAGRAAEAAATGRAALLDIESSGDRKAPAIARRTS